MTVAVAVVAVKVLFGLPTAVVGAALVHVAAVDFAVVHAFDVVKAAYGVVVSVVVSAVVSQHSAESVVARGSVVCLKVVVD